MTYQIEVPEGGTYALAVYVMLEDYTNAYGAKYTVNGEYSFQTSYQFSVTELMYIRENQTSSSYMFGITLELKAGTNTIKIEGASNTEYNQLFRTFYLVKVAN